MTAADPPRPVIRPALPVDARTIRTIVDPYAEDRILLAKDLVGYFESVPEFLVAEEPVTGEVIGCGALHVMWEDLGEVRTLAVRPDRRGTGVGHELTPIEGDVVDREVYLELLLSRDDGIAEFLDLARVKPNTLGNTRMLRRLD